MKTYKTYLFFLIALAIIYIIIELNKPKVFDWSFTFRNNDDNPYGCSVLYKELKQVFSGANIYSHREPAFNVLLNNNETASAYCIIAPEIVLKKTDLAALLKYASAGCTVFIASSFISKNLLDTLGIKQQQFYKFLEKDSISLNFSNPSLHSTENYHYRKGAAQEYFSALQKNDSTFILGSNNYHHPNFIKVKYGKGIFLLHASPVCFSNYYMLFKNNAEYASKALSAISPAIKIFHWDEFYKAGREGATTPLRFFLSNIFLKWALRLAIITLIIYVLFQAKRRQRIIPIIEPLRNTTLDFVETVSSVYYSRHDNNAIAQKKIQFFTDFVKQHYYLQVKAFDETAALQLSHKSGIAIEKINELIHQLKRAATQPAVTDETLMALDKNLDEFYKISKI